MDAKLFQLLAKSLKEAAAISRGEAESVEAFAQKKKNSSDIGRAKVLVKKPSTVSGNKPALSGRSVERTEPYRVDAKVVRELTGLSQSDFALVMNVSVKTLQNWEQHRREPTGPAEALLKIVSKEPHVAITALNS
ncbi:helix-turn-helix domain-containing protein [Massilia sp. SM-13]|uniref:helix-turn-helix domain-containing protein n=1 Tax=Pseudoduganella rhizocola TaxID=3382643 RepID=UPI0038B5BC92